MTELTRRERLIKIMREELEHCKKIQELMKKLEKGEADSYTQADQQQIHAQFLALQSRHEQTLAEYYKMTKPTY
jgi:hypothetical protein